MTRWPPALVLTTEGNNCVSTTSVAFMDWQYKYKCKVRKIVDGDTVDLTIDLGMGTFVHERCRLYGIDAPEVRGEERALGYLSKQRLGELLKGCLHIWCETHMDKTGKYGRYLVELFTEKSTVSINKQLVESGLAKSKYYK